MSTEPYYKTGTDRVGTQSWGHWWDAIYLSLSGCLSPPSKAQTNTFSVAGPGSDSSSLPPTQVNCESSPGFLEAPPASTCPLGS